MNSIYLDNGEGTKEFKKSIERLKQTSMFAKIDEKDVKLISSIRGRIEDELIEEIIGAKKFIITNSTYSDIFKYNSKKQLFKILRRIGNLNVKGLNYINANNSLLDALNDIKSIDFKYEILPILKAINLNNFYYLSHDGLYKISLDIRDDAIVNSVKYECI